MQERMKRGRRSETDMSGTIAITRAAVVDLNFRAGSTFPVPVCTVPNSMDRISQCNKVDAVRLYASYRLNLLLLKGQRCVLGQRFSDSHCMNYNTR